MKEYQLSQSEATELINGLEEKFGVPFESIDAREGCLTDYFIGRFNIEGSWPVTIMAKEHYLNPNSSDLTVTIARTEKDNEKLLKRWDEFTEAYDKEQEELER
ncbi:MAG: hypothetical protein J6O00_10825 [Clostridiales bacterium]|nr:hypothetical protein [Clostridiales bacterium]